MIKTQLRQQFVQMLTDSPEAPDETEAEALLDQLDGEGHFPDVNYADQQRSMWHVQLHFERMVQILSCRRVREDSAWRDRAMKGFDFWIRAGFENPNWWHNEIGQPRLLGRAALLLEPWLTEEQRELSLRILRRGSLYSRPELYERWEGANLLWGVSNTLQHALLEGDPTIAEEALRHAAAELGIADKDRDGIKEDFSFFQHGVQLYSGGYGRSFIEEFAAILYVLRTTPLQLPFQALANLADFILDGGRWMMLGASWDFTTVGREISRPEGISDRRFTEALRLLAQVDELPRRQELAAFAASVQSGTALPLQGDRVFPLGRLYVSHRNGRYIGTRVTDPGQIMGETLNAENFYSANLYGGGITCLMGDAMAYDRLPAVWNPCYMPGVTARLESDTSLMAKRELWNSKYAENQYGRVVSLSSKEGCAFQDIVFNGITGVLARFFVDGCMVALGAGLCADGPEPIVTALDQCRVRHPVREQMFSCGMAVAADGFLYVILDGKTMHWKEEYRTGDWKRINEACKEPPETANVRTLWLEHGIAPQNASYAYAVIPVDKAEAIPGKIEVLYNTPAIQAIRVDNRVLSVFHQASILTLPDGRQVQGCPAEAGIWELEEQSSLHKIK